MDKFQSFLQNMKGKRVAVAGVGVSNTPLIRLLAAAGALVTACDKKPLSALPAAAELQDAGISFHCGGGYLTGLDHDYIFRTPGLRPDMPELLAAAAGGSVITSEMECFFDVCPCPILAVTGSDGKTTTTTLIAKILAAAGRACHIGGNIGAPLLPKTPEMSPSDFAVVELSSFQLFTMKKSPHVAVITNISPNHLDIHRDMEEYIAAKENIFLHQSPEDILVLNAGNAYTPRFAAKAPGRIRYFSGASALPSGFFRESGAVMYREPLKSAVPVVSVSDIFLPGAHNVENYMAAAAAAMDYADFSHVAHVARTFTGVAHRIEYIRTADGVRYYNDSIASSPTRTLAGLRSFDRPVLLIAGGYDKHISFDELGRAMPGLVKFLFLTGDTADKIEAAVKNAPGWSEAVLPVLRCGTLADAVAAAKDKAVPGDVVLMSPACASFDRYRNFEERGQAFRDIVMAL